MFHLHVLLFIAVLIICGVRHGYANVYMFKPLECAPTNVSYFANDPRYFKDVERRGITKTELDQIIRTGIFNKEYKDWASLRKNLIDKGIHGIFFNQDGNGYRWDLIDEQIMYIESASGCSGYITGNFVSIIPFAIPFEKEKPLKVSPNTIKAMGFHSDKPVQGPVIKIKKERINNFLEHGKAMDGNSACKCPLTGKITDDISGKVYYRYPNESSGQSSQGVVSNKSDGRMTSGQKVVNAIQVTGSILASDGNIYFWNLKDDNHLHLEDEHRNGCILFIGESGTDELGPGYSGPRDSVIENKRDKGRTSK